MVKWIKLIIQVVIVIIDAIERGIIKVDAKQREKVLSAKAELMEHPDIQKEMKAD